MDKCLVTKLGNTVSADFPKLGELIINISTVDMTPSGYFYLVGSDAELRGEITFSDESTEIESGYANRKYLAADKTGQLVVLNKYGLTTFCITVTGNCFKVTGSPIELKDLTFNPSFNNIDGGNKDHTIAGNIALFNGHAMTRCRLDNNSDIVGDIVNMAQTYISAMQKTTPTPVANISFKNTNVEGTVESLVQAIRAAGVTSSDNKGHSLILGGSKVKFNNQDISASTGTLDWTEETITYNGVTITDVTNNA